MKKIYVAGPMRGKRRYNFPAFDRAQARLEARGWTVFSPAQHDRDLGFDETAGTWPESYTLGEAFRWDLERIMEADALYMLPGWSRSQGASAEHAVALMLGLDVLGASK